MERILEVLTHPDSGTLVLVSSAKSCFMIISLSSVFLLSYSNFTGSSAINFCHITARFSYFDRNIEISLGAAVSFISSL